MKDCELLLSSWEQILHKLSKNNGNVHPIEIGKRATTQEIEAKERELSYQLPSSYKYILQNLGKSLSFYYSFSKDTMIPCEFNEIFSGEINWNIDYLQNLDELADELFEDGEDYGKTLRGKLEFSHAGNGDVYAFDMSVESEEKPVIYWDHEEDTVTYIADSFIDYLALSHLKDFHSRKVIEWMEKHVRFPVTDGWDELFLKSNFSWADIERWTSLEEKHEVTVIHALDKYVEEKAANDFHHEILGLPTKSDLTDFLVKLRDKQVLKKRRHPIEDMIKNINLFY